MNSATSTATKLAPETSAAPTRKAYVCGHSEEELKRLEIQGTFLSPSTRDFLQRAGVTEGMRVLDVGSGSGDVAFLAAELVGPTGEVVGFDRAEAAVSLATARAQAKGLSNVRFVQCDIDHVVETLGSAQFDAIVGRTVIMHQRKPVEAVRTLMRMVRPGGVVAFQEPDVGEHWATHKLTSLEHLSAYLRQWKEAGILAKNLGADFIKAFDEAGVTQRRVIRTGAVESQPSEGMYTWITTLARMLAVAGPGAGLPPPAYDPATFDTTLKSEVEKTGASFIPAFWVGAAGRLPCVRSV